MAVVNSRVCNKCGVEKPLTLEFFRQTVDSKSVKRVRYFRRGCISCERPYWDAANKRRWVVAKKKQALLRQEMVDYLGGKCAHCGVSYPTCVYDFHHIDPSTKLYNVSTMVSSFATKRDVLFAELDKCLLLCANCHRKFHWGGSDSRR